MNHRPPPRRRPLVAALIAGTLLPIWLEAADPLEDVQKLATEWARVRAETVRVEADWNAQKTLMGATLDAVQARVRQLEERRAALEVKTAGGRREAEELADRRQAIKAATEAAGAELRRLGEQLVRLRPWLPPRLSGALELPFRSLAAPELGLAERMQHTTTILNRCGHFNRTVARAEEMVVPPGGEPKLMEVVYWGLSHGYALDRAGGTAFVGGPAEDGWRWTPAPELARPVARLLAVAADQTEPELVVLPVQPGEPPVLNQISGGDRR